MIAMFSAVLVSSCESPVAPDIVPPAPISFQVGEREILVTRAQRDALGLPFFVDGNLGYLRDGSQHVVYGANGPNPVRITGTPENPFEKVDPVRIETASGSFDYMSGGPVYVDPASGRVLLFYHAEIHRGTVQSFYSVLGVAIQTDETGLVFQDVGTIFTAQVPEEEAVFGHEACGAPYVIKDGYFYVYARDALTVPPGQSNLSVARAPVDEVVSRARQGQSATWLKYRSGEFSQPGNGGASTPLEDGNPTTRWMDVTYNTELDLFLLVVAAGSGNDIDLFVTWSEDGIQWAPRERLIDDPGECFYPSIIGLDSAPRQTGRSFHVYYTFSRQGGFDRWVDATLVRRLVTVGY